MKKIFLFAAALVLAVSMNLRAAEVPLNVQVMQLIAELVEMRETPMPNSCLTGMQAAIAAVEAATADGKEPTAEDWEALYAGLKTSAEKCVKGIALYQDFKKEIKAAEELLAAAKEGDPGYAELKAALDKAKEAYEKGTAESKGDIDKIVNAFTSELNPKDVTGLIPNADFSKAIDSTNWIVTANEQITWSVAEPGNGFAGKYLKAESSKKFQGYTIEQTVTGLPKGDYKLTATIFKNEEGNYTKGTINFSANSQTVKVGNSSADGGAVISLYVRVTDGKLAIKLTETDNRNTEVSFGDVKLEYLNFRSWVEWKEDETSYTATISGPEQLADAFLKTDFAEGKDVNYLFANGTYDLGVDVARIFPQNWGSVRIAAANGASPVLSGSLRTKGMKARNLIIEGITFRNETGSTSTDLSPLHLAKGQKDTVLNEVVIRNCKFYDLPACVIRINAGNNTEKYIHSVLVENNYIDGISHHLFQFAGGKNIGVANFTFRENVVKNMYATGGQFFNCCISPNHPEGETVYTMTVEHNTFYKIGGVAEKARNFLECNKDNDWEEVYININNNIFYDRYGWDNYAESDVPLFNAKENQKVEVNFLKNVLAPADVMVNDALQGDLEGVNFPVISGNIKPVYDNIAADTTGFWADSLNLNLYTDSEYAFAGINGTYIGAKSTYKVNPNATEGEPTDATFLIENPFFSNEFEGWTITADTSLIEYKIAEGGYGFAHKYIEATSAKKFQNYAIEQTLKNIPNGDYKFTAKIYYIEEANYGKGTLQLMANDKTATVSKSSADGGAETSVYVRVTDGTLTLKMFHKDNRNTVVCFGDPKLEYYNHRSWARVGKDSISATVSCYEELIDALAFQGYKGEATINITGGEYQLGTATRAYPAGLKKLVINGNGNKVYGALLNSKGGLSIEEVIIENVAFIGNGAATETAAPICTQGNDNFGSVTFLNCSFTDLNDPLCRLRAGSTVGKLAYVGCTIKNQGAAVNGGNHTFICNNGNQILNEFVLSENIFDNYQGKQFMQFANVKISVDTMKIKVTNNVFRNFYNGEGSNATNFLEGCKVTNLDVYVANNLFYYDSIPGEKRQPAAINPGGTYTYYGVTLLNNVYNLNEGIEIMNAKTGADPDIEEDIYFEGLGLEGLSYQVGDMFLKSHPFYTAGVNGTYIGPKKLYYTFDVAEEGFVVDNLASFNELMSYKNVPEEMVVLFKDNTDECGYYALGMDARNFPQNFCNLTFKAYKGAAPKISGSFRSSNGMKVKNLVLEGLNFVEGNMNGKTDASPVFFNKGVKDTVMNQVIIRNCTFTDMPACMIRINANNDTEKYIHGILIENNVIDGINHHFFQFAGGKAFGTTSFIFRENIVKNMAATGGQFFNTCISTKHPAGETVYTMTVEHNTFYKIGGCATAARKFLECNKDNDFEEVYLNFNNNIFYDRYSWDNYAESDVALFNAKEGQKVEVNFLKNIVAPVDVMANDGIMDEKWDCVSFPVTEGNIEPVYDNIEADTTDFWYDAEKLYLSDKSEYYTAGVNGTYIGALESYTEVIEAPENAAYWWQSNSKGVVTEKGGKAEGYEADGSISGRVNYANKGNYTICLNGKKDWKSQYVEVKLDKAIAAGDTILIAAYRDKGDASKKSNAYFDFNGTGVGDGTDGLYYADIQVTPEAAPTTWTFVAPDAAVGCTSFKMAREQAGTNLFIVKLGILSKASDNAPAIDALEGVKSISAIYANNGVVYLNMNEASEVEVFDMVGRSIRKQNVNEGLNAIEGLSAGQIYIVRTSDAMVKIAL